MIRKTTFDGLDAVEMITHSIKIILVTGVGPRIAFFGTPDGENLLYWKKNEVSRGDWCLHGGHRVWITRPYADESEDTYMADNEPCEVVLEKNAVSASSLPHFFTRLSRRIRIEFVSDHSVKVCNSIKNEGGLIYSGGVWSPTCIVPEGKTIYVDIGEENATWDIVRMVIPLKFAGNTVALNDPQVTFTDAKMVIKPAGQVTKRCVSAPKGKIYLEWPQGNLRFIKQVQYRRDGRYPFEGCNIAVFVGQNNWMAEMETFGIEQSIHPGEEIFNEEIWKLELLT